MLTVYLLESIPHPGNIYIGKTHDLDARLKAHNAGSSVYARRHRPWRVLVSIDFSDDSRAAAFEAYLKTASGRAFSERHFR